jgi:glutamate-1-semialdehyde 2,1-aminomutase
MTWPDSSSNSNRLFERARRVLPGGISRLQTLVEPFPIYAGSGHGASLVDVDGVARIDFMNNFASLIHGHAHPEVLAAVHEAVDHGSCFSMPTEREIQMAELITERIPRIDKIRFCNSGTEAVMLAIKAARARTGRPCIAKIEGAYHGMYDYAEVSLDSSPDNWGDVPNATPYTVGTPAAVLADTIVIPFNDAATTERLLRDSGDRLAAVLIDPAPLSCGLVPISEEYTAMLHRVTGELGALLILDEVIAYRLDYHGAQARFGIQADLTTFGKIIGGGFPVGAVGGTDAAMSVFSHANGKPLNASSGTFTANPVSVAAGLRTLELLDNKAYQALEEVGAYARQVCSDAFAASRFKGQVTGIGSMFHLHLHDRPVSDYRTFFARENEAAAIRRIHQKLLHDGFILAPKLAGFLSTVNTPQQLDQFAQSLEKILAES